jgi:L-lactate dehydrogenase complex protein LldF
VSEPGGERSHPERAAEFLRDGSRARWHDDNLWQIRQRRDQAARSLPEWERLRAHAGQVKAHVLSRLPHYLRQLEHNARTPPPTSIC